MKKKLFTAASALAAVILAAIPAQSQAFFGFFGGGFSFGVGGGYWGGPGWWGPYGYGPGYGRHHRWLHPYHRRFYRRWHHPYLAHRFWGFPRYGYPYFHHVPVVGTLPAVPAVTVEAPEVKAK